MITLRGGYIILMEHAILIICHNNLSVVKNTMTILDDSRFHFYIMIDKKSSIQNEDLSKVIKESTGVFLDRESINWGGYSYTHAVFSLINEALKNPQIKYFHMLQGADMPLKTPEEIDAFCLKHNGMSFVNFRENDFQSMANRMGCKHFFVDTKHYRTSKALQYLDKAVAKIQMPYNKEKRFWFHSALFTIARPFAEFFVNQEGNAEKKYKYSLLAEESLMGTILMNSEFRNQCNGKIDTRLIDWSRRQGSSPHTYTSEDYQMLLDAMKTDYVLFARKFSETVDKGIVDMLTDELLKRKNA